MTITGHVDPTFTQRIGQWAAAAGKNIGEAFGIQGRLYCGELIQRTPPFSGRAIVRMLTARGAALKDLDVEPLTAKRVGERRVEKDIRRVIYGVNGAGYVGDKQAMANAVEWGVLQKCEERQAVRLFAKKSGEVYGVDTAQFIPSPDMSALGKHHKSARGARGRVTTAGTRDRKIGRWVWLNVVVTKEAILKRYIKAVQKAVGQAKGGWAEAFMRLGGRMSRSGWVGEHASTHGEARVKIEPWNAEILIINKSKWANGGDEDRIRQTAMQGRDRAIKADIERILKEKWGK